MVSNSTTTGQGEREYTLIRISSHPYRSWLFRDPEGFALAIAKRFERKDGSVANSLKRYNLAFSAQSDEPEPL